MTWKKRKKSWDIIKESVSIDIFPAEVKAKFAEYNDIIKKKFEGVVKDNNIPEARKDMRESCNKRFLMYVMNKYDKIGDKSQAPEV